MGLLEIAVIGISLAMDAFTVSICKGLSLNKVKFIHSFLVGVYFGIFQFFMPIFGFILSNRFSNYIIDYDHYIAFILLLILGINMFSNKDEKVDDDFSFKTMILLSIATSIDALAVGITFSFFKVDILKSSCIIGIITFLMCSIGIFIGSIVNIKTGVAKRVGGIVLIIIGIKILIEHLFF